MKSTPAPYTHTGLTAKELTVQFGPSGGTQYTVLVPAGTACIKLDGGSSPWVVQDLRFMSDKRSLMYSDADHYGIRIEEAEITDIAEVQSRIPRPRF